MDANTNQPITYKQKDLDSSCLDLEYNGNYFHTYIPLWLGGVANGEEKLLYCKSCNI